MTVPEEALSLPDEYMLEVFPVSELLKSDAKNLIKDNHMILKPEMEENLIFLLGALNEILATTKYGRIWTMPEKEYNAYKEAFESSEKSFANLSEFSRGSNITGLRKLLQAEKEKFLLEIKCRGEGALKNRAAYLAAIHIGLFLKETVGLKEFKYYLKAKMPGNPAAALALKIFALYGGHVDGHDAALKYVQKHFDDIDQNSLKSSEF